MRLEACRQGALNEAGASSGDCVARTIGACQGTAALGTSEVVIGLRLSWNGVGGSSDARL
jgi:hypothetical protein